MDFRVFLVSMYLFVVEAIDLDFSIKDKDFRALFSLFTILFICFLNLLCSIFEIIKSIKMPGSLIGASSFKLFRMWFLGVFILESSLDIWVGSSTGMFTDENGGFMLVSVMRGSTSV